jgi:hypothetical protein
MQEINPDLLEIIYTWLNSLFYGTILGSCLTQIGQIGMAVLGNAIHAIAIGGIGTACYICMCPCALPCSPILLGWTMFQGWVYGWTSLFAFIIWTCPSVLLYSCVGSICGGASGTIPFVGPIGTITFITLIEMFVGILGGGVVAFATALLDFCWFPCIGGIIGECCIDVFMGCAYGAILGGMSGFTSSTISSIFTSMCYVGG